MNASFSFASMFGAQSLSAAFDHEVETAAKAGRVSASFIKLADTLDGVAIPPAKAGFDRFSRGFLGAGKAPLRSPKRAAAYAAALGTIRSLMGLAPVAAPTWGVYAPKAKAAPTATATPTATPATTATTATAAPTTAQTVVDSIKAGLYGHDGLKAIMAACAAHLKQAAMV